MRNTKPLTLNVTIDITPQPVETPGYRIGTMGIGNTNFHVECIAVSREDEAGCWVAQAQDFQSRIDAVEAEMGGKLALTKLPDDPRDWFIVITPFED